MDEQILFKAKKQTLLTIKEEAEKNLLGIQITEDVITSKSNSLIQILIPIFIIISGYIIKSVSEKKFNELFFISIPLVLLLSIVIWKLYQNILPVKTAINGSEPNQLVQSDMVKGIDESDQRNIMVNRIYNLQKAIDYSVQSHTNRYKRFKNSYKTLLIGFLLIFISTIIFFLFRLFPLFQDKC